MVLKVYSIRDSKGEKYFPPFYKTTHGEAERDFTTAARDAKSTISLYPEDFDLYYLGTYDDESGKLSPLDAPQHMSKAVQFVDK